jgi:hypothetical protein
MICCSSLLGNWRTWLQTIGNWAHQRFVACQQLFEGQERVRSNVELWRAQTVNKCESRECEEDETQFKEREDETGHENELRMRER